MNTIREDEMRRLLKGIFKPVVASSEFKERLLKHLTQEVSRQTIQSPVTPQGGEGDSGLQPS
jgi:hypothetical protein